GFTQFDQTARSQVATVAHDANATLGFASQHGTDFHPLNARCLDRTCQVFRDLIVDVHHHVAIVIFDLLKRHAADDPVAQRLDNFASFHDSSHVNAVHRAAIVFADDYILSNVNQAASQVARVGCLERR